MRKLIGHKSKEYRWSSPNLTLEGKRGIGDGECVCVVGVVVGGVCIILYSL